MQASRQHYRTVHRGQQEVEVVGMTKSLRDHMRRISKRGVEARRKKRAAQLVSKAGWPLPHGRLPESVADWQRVGASAAKAMWTGELDPRVAKEIAGLVRASLAAFKVGAMAKRVDELEALIAQLLANVKEKRA